MKKKRENSEKVQDTGLLSRLSEMNQEQKKEFCAYLVAYGASYYTMRDKICYGNGWFSGWEVTGINRLIGQYAPEYVGESERFFVGLTKKAEFVKFMTEYDMGRTSVYNRFTTWNFKPWEVIGISRLLDNFLKL